MTGTTGTRAARLWLWVVVIVAAATISASAFGVWSGQCIDIPSDSSAGSACTSGPAVGWPAAWAILAVCVVLVIVSTSRLRSRRHPRRED